MDSPHRLSSPTKALYPVSPKRMNQQSMASSPSMPSDLGSLQRPRGTSEVQAKVAFLNSLSRGQSPAASHHSSSSSSSAAALQRAILGREEAESALASVSAQLSEAQSRERRTSERLESLLEELHAAKERQAHERSVFEKEIRKARKEAFRAGSAVVKIQEELKHSRNEAKALKDEVKSERDAKEKAKQEAFERAYALAGLTEELEVLKGKLRSLEANNHSDTLEARALEMREADMGRPSLTEGDSSVSTPTPRRPKRAAADSVKASPLDSTDVPDKLDTPPKRPRLSEPVVSSDDEDIFAPETEDDLITELQEELKMERKLRIDAEDMVDFLKMECQFKRCSCRLAESQGTTYIHDASWVMPDNTEETVEKSEHVEDNLAPALHETEVSCPVPDIPAQDSQPNYEDLREDETATDAEAVEEQVLTFSPVTGTFRTVPSPVRSPSKTLKDTPSMQHQSPVSRSHDAANLFSPPSLASPRGEVGASPQRSHYEFSTIDEAATQSPFHITSPPRQPVHHQVPHLIVETTPESEPQPREYSTTTTIPLREEEVSPNPFATIPGTPISREEALAQIRARRGRAQSIKRSISANEAAIRSGGMGTTPVRSARRIPGLHSTSSKKEGDMGSRRDLSAPVKLFR